LFQFEYTRYSALFLIQSTNNHFLPMRRNTASDFCVGEMHGNGKLTHPRPLPHKLYPSPSVPSKLVFCPHLSRSTWLPFPPVTETQFPSPSVLAKFTTVSVIWDIIFELNCQHTQNSKHSRTKFHVFCKKSHVLWTNSGTLWMQSVHINTSGELRLLQSAATVYVVIPWNKQPFPRYYRNFSHHYRGITAAVGSSNAGKPRLPRYSRHPHYCAALYSASLQTIASDRRTIRTDTPYWWGHYAHSWGWS